jgi:hypothetical protein
VKAIEGEHVFENLGRREDELLKSIRLMTAEQGFAFTSLQRTPKWPPQSFSEH